MAKLEEYANPPGGFIVSPTVGIGGGSASPTLIKDNINKDVDVSTSNDKFWKWNAVSKTKWSELWPYQFRIVRSMGDGGYKTISKFTLPISPNQLQVGLPFASQVTVTLRGILEEHNGVPLRDLSFSGTTGVWPFRGQADKRDTPSSIESIFAGTIAANNTLNSIDESIQGRKKRNNVSDPSEGSGSADLKEMGTGYFQFHLLHKFLESYALAKKGLSHGKQGNLGDPRSLRLAVCMWKDDWVWLVTPKRFTLTRSSRDPFQYDYSFQATGWKRLPKLDGDLGMFIRRDYTSVANLPNGFQKMVSTLTNVRRSVQAATRLIGAIRSDINRSLFEPLRETIFFLKDVVGLQKTIIDLPSAVVSDFQHTVIRNFGNLKDTFDAKFTRRGSSPGSPRPIGKLLEDSSRKVEQEGLTSLPAQSADPLNKIFQDPISNQDFFNNIEIDGLDMEQDLLEKVQDEEDRVAAFTRTDFEDKRSLILASSADFANELGLGNNTYNRLIGRNLQGDASATLPTLKEVFLDPSPEKLDPLFSIQEAAMEFDRLIASRSIDDNKLIDSFDFIAGLANDADIEFIIPKSKLLVPVPFNSSVEGISNLYLGNPDRWLEIATLNNLKAPYIDEDGFLRTLETNADGNKFTITSKENLFIGQSIKLFSSTIPIFNRRITNIEEISIDNILITVDGEPDLSNLKTADTAQMKAFLPNTVNSEQLIFIPSDALIEEDDIKAKPIPGITDINNLVKISGIDLLLDHNGDLAITRSGDIRLAFGLTNIIQAARLKIETPKGGLLRHPNFGFGITPGISTAEISAQDVFDAIQGSFVEDNRFQDIENIKVIKKGPVLQITLTVAVAGVESLIPISVQIRV